MAFSIWKIQCSGCAESYPRHCSQCPSCRRKNPHTIGKLLKILLILLALAATVAIWIAVVKKSRG